MFSSEVLTASGVRISQEQCAYNRCNERHNRQSNTHLTWECLEKHTLLHLVVRPEKDGGSDESVGMCRVKCVAVSWYSVHQIIRLDMVKSIRLYF